ncbi:MAG: hypothetical protein ACK511_15495, partial [Burkholderiales bacterium]
EEEAAQIAKRQATETGKVGMPSAPGVARPDAAAPAAVAVSKPAVPPASPSTTPPAANPADTVKDAKEAVNKLRGLFGK